MQSLERKALEKTEHSSSAAARLSISEHEPVSIQIRKHNKCMQQ